MFIAILRRPDARWGVWISAFDARISALMLKARLSYTDSAMLSSSSFCLILMRLLSS